MARPRSFSHEQVIATAKNLFWDRGYGSTSIAELESATGLSRSSLYLAFDTKLGLFEAALDDYQRSFIDTLLGPIEAKGAGLEEAAGFFLALAGLFHDPTSQRGCLQINTIAELAGREPSLGDRSARFADRFRAAFTNALRGPAGAGATDTDSTVRRAELLTSAAMGVWVAVRADHEAAARTCLAVAAEIESWARPVPYRAAPRRIRRR